MTTNDPTRLPNDINSPHDDLEDKFGPYHRASEMLNGFNYKDTPNETQALRLLLIDEPLHDEELRIYWQENLQEDDFSEVSLETAERIVKAITDLKEAPYNLGRDHLSNLAMSLSLCPIHFVDWAICFDDQPAECSQVRFIFPKSHDT